MKKPRCAVCSSTKARRKCNKHDQRFICSRCCGDQRDSECTACQYFMAAEQYQSHKSRKAKEKKFILELIEEAENRADEAFDLIKDGNMHEGELILKELNARYPGYYKVTYGLGVVHAFKEELDEAVEYFRKATDAFPYFMEAHFNLAVAFKKKLDFRNMVKSFREVIEIGDPENDLVREAREFVSSIAKNIEDEFGISLDRYFSAQDEFEEAFSFMEKGEWNKAARGFEKCIKLNGRHPQSHGNLGLCYAKLGRKAEANAAFDKALVLDPEYEPALVNKAVVELLPEGQNLDQERLEFINYYRDYSSKKGSYVEAVLKELRHR